MCASTKTTPDALRRIPLCLVGGTELPRVIDALLNIDEPCGTCISDAPPAIATRHADDPALALLTKPLGNRERDATIVTPPSRARMLAPRPGGLIFVDLGRRSPRLGRVAYARSLFDSEMLFAYINLDRLTGNDPDVVIGLWQAFVWNWARLGRHLGEEGAALTAEMALGITARRYYLTATTDQFTLALSTADPIIAELAGRGIRQLAPGRRDDYTRTPWEAPIVQRSAELGLGLGVQSPDRIELQAKWADPDSDYSPFASYVERFADLLSITM